MRLALRQRLRNEARQERGQCWLLEAFLSSWEAAEVRSLAIREGVGVEVAAGALVRLGLDALLSGRKETGTDGQVQSEAA